MLSKRARRGLFLAAVIPGLAFAVLLAKRWGDPVLLVLNPDIGAVRPRTYPVMNPFRDRAPERTAEILLLALQRGDRRRLAELRVSEHVQQREEQYPIRSWRIAGRKDGVEGVALAYWVRRGGGYHPGEEECFITLDRSPVWSVTAFSAIY